MKVRKTACLLIVLVMMTNPFLEVLAEEQTMVTGPDGSSEPAPPGEGIHIEAEVSEAAGEYKITGADVHAVNTDYGLSVVNYTNAPVTVQSDVNINVDTTQQSAVVVEAGEGSGQVPQTENTGSGSPDGNTDNQGVDNSVIDTILDDSGQYAGGLHADTQCGGDVSVDAKEVTVSTGGETDTTYGVFIGENTGSENDSNSSGTVSVDADGVKVTAENTAAGAVLKADDEISAVLNVGEKGISVSGGNSVGALLSAEKGGSASATIEKKGITVSGGEATGVFGRADNPGTEISLNISNGGITVASENGSAAGISMEAHNGADASAKVAGVVSASADFGNVVGIILDAVDDNTTVKLNTDGIQAKCKDNAIGLEITAVDGSAISAEIGKDGIKATGSNSAGALLESKNGASVSLSVKGDVHSYENGLILFNGEGSTAGSTDVFIEGTLSGEIRSVAVGSANVKDAVSLTVWKAELNHYGKVAEAIDASLSGEAEKFEKRILYIIKVEQPEAGGSLSIARKDGKDIARSHSEKVANEGDIILLRADVEDGYKLTAAYNGKGLKIDLLKNENGEYYVIVPKGGGVYLTAELEYIGDIEEKEENQPRKEQQRKEQQIEELKPIKDEPKLQNEEPKPQNQGRIRYDEEIGRYGPAYNYPKTYIVGLYDNPQISITDANIISNFSGEQQVAIVLTKLGMEGVLRVCGLRLKDIAKKAAESIKSDLSSLVKTERLTIDGETADWQVIRVCTNGKIDMYCFRMLIDGTWISKVISES